MCRPNLAVFVSDLVNVIKKEKKMAEPEVKMSPTNTFGALTRKISSTFMN
jgi:hypothetical protein